MQIQHLSMLKNPEAQFLIIEPQKDELKNSSMCRLYAEYITRIMYRTATIKPDSVARDILRHNYYTKLMETISNCNSKINILEIDEEQFDTSRVVVYVCRISMLELMRLHKKIDVNQLIISILEPIFLDITEVIDQHPEMSPKISIRRGLLCNKGNKIKTTAKDLMSVIEFLEDEFIDYGITVDIYDSSKPVNDII